MRKEALSSESCQQFRYKLCLPSFSTSVTRNTSLNAVSLVVVSLVWEEKANRSQQSILSLFNNMRIKHTEIQRKSNTSLRKLTFGLLPHRTPKVHTVSFLICTLWRLIVYILYIYIGFPCVFKSEMWWSMYGGRDVALGEFSTVSAAAGLRYSGKHPLKQKKEPPPNSLACAQGLDPVTASTDMLRKITCRHSRSIQRSIT